jgi:hypothetical protein
MKLIDEAGSGNALRPRQLLEIRQKFDNIFGETGGRLGDDVLSAKNFSALNLRRTLNDLLKDTIKDPDVHDFLDRQHEGLKALDIVNRKRIPEMKNMFSRSWSKLKEYGHLPSTPLALYATATAVGASGLAPVAAGSLAIGTAAWQTYKAMAGPQKRKALAQMLSAMDKSIKADPKMADILSADRALIVEMIKDINEEPVAEGDI